MSVFQDWDFTFEVDSLKGNNEKTFIDFSLQLHEQILKLISDGSKVQSITYNPSLGEFKVESNIDSDSLGQSHDEELRILVEKNKQLRQEIDNKVKEISHKQSQYENYKQDQKLLTQEIIETHKTFLMVNKYHKKNLKMYHTIEATNNEKQTVFVQFFTESKKDSENYSMRLLRDRKTRRYELLSTTPQLPIFKEVQKKLNKSNNVPEALCTIRQAFNLMRAESK